MTRDPGQRLGRLLSVVVLLAIVGLVAALTHLLAILLLPKVATKDAYSLLLTRARETGHAILFPPSRPGDATIPFRDPATVQGLCFYDVTAAPFRIRLRVEEGHLVTLSFRTPDGRIFYSMTDRAALNGSIDIRLLTDAQLKDVEDADDDDAGLPSELRLKVPEPKGLLVATALIARRGDAQDAERQITAITCAPEPLPPPS